MRLLSAMQALMMILPAWGGAQTAWPGEWPVAAGSRIRIQAPVLGDKRQTATVVAATSDSLSFRSRATDMSVATSQITTLEIAQGTRTQVGKGALMGFLIGAFSGAAIGVATYDPCEACFIDFDRSGTALLSGILGAGVGTVVGALAGLRRVDNWVPVRLR